MGKMKEIAQEVQEWVDDILIMEIHSNDSLLVNDLVLPALENSLILDDLHNYPAKSEILQWFGVSPVLAEELRRLGEATIISAYGNWWGRLVNSDIRKDETILRIATDRVSEFYELIKKE